MNNRTKRIALAFSIICLLDLSTAYGKPKAPKFPRTQPSKTAPAGGDVGDRPASEYACSYNSEIDGQKNIDIEATLKVGDHKVIPLNPKDLHSPGVWVSISAITKNPVFKGYLDFGVTFIEDLYSYNQTGEMSTEFDRGFLSTQALPAATQVNAFTGPGGGAKGASYSLSCELKPSQR